jgi:hypothetical protein
LLSNSTATPAAFGISTSPLFSSVRSSHSCTSSVTSTITKRLRSCIETGMPSSSSRPLPGAFDAVSASSLQPPRTEWTSNIPARVTLATHNLRTARETSAPRVPAGKVVRSKRT